MTPEVEGQIGTSLRNLLNRNGLSDVKIVGYEVIHPLKYKSSVQKKSQHNWDNAGTYPVALVCIIINETQRVLSRN